jgi:hypothetical protein
MTDLPQLFREQRAFDRPFIEVLDRHVDPIPLGQLTYEARELGASTSARYSARIWAASAHRRRMIIPVTWYMYTGPHFLLARHPENVSRESVLAALQPGAPRCLHLAALAEIGFSRRVLALVGGRTEEQISKWTELSPDIGLPQHLDDLRAVSDRMIEEGTRHPRMVGTWFTRPQHSLGGRVPIEVLISHRFEDVLEATRE